MDKELKNLAATIEVRNFASLMDFGATAQKEVAQYSNYLSDQLVKMDDSYTRTNLVELLKLLSRIDLVPFKPKRFLFWKIRRKRPLLEQIGQLQKQVVQLDYVAERLKISNGYLLREVDHLEKFHKENSKFEATLSKWIAAAQLRHQELSQLKLPTQHEQPDLQHFLQLLDQRIYDLQMSKSLATQKGAQIKTLQEGFRHLGLKVQTSILTTIPLWQDQLNLLLAWEKQIQIGELVATQTRMIEEIKGLKLGK